MGFRPCIDFFRRNKTILFTKAGIDKLSNIKITGTKIPKFFKLKLEFPDEEEDSEDEEGSTEDLKTSYRIWTQIFNFPFVPKRNPKKQEKYRSVEEIIKNYLEKSLDKKWINYPPDKYDIFESNDFLGGVPDGEEIDSEGKTVSILEIKTITDIRNKKEEFRFSQAPLSYCLQLSLYLFLRGIDTGYICICYLKPENWENTKTISLKSPLNKYSFEPIKIEGVLSSWLEEIGECSFEYQLLESRCNNFLEDNEVILFKVQINLEKFSNLIEKLCDWFVKYKEVSPPMTEKELEALVTKHKKW